MNFKETALCLPVLGLVMGLGCAGDDPETTPEGTATPAEVTDPPATPTPEEPTATPVPPTPTPSQALELSYRTNVWHVEAGKGVDMDSDGTVDNAFYDMFVVVQGVAYDVAYAQAVATLQPLEDDGTIPQGTTEVIATQMAEALSAIFSAESFNAAVDTLVASGALNYVETMTGTPDNLQFTWYSAAIGTGQPYTAEKLIGVQAGSANGASAEVGPADLTYDFGVLTPIHEEAAVLALEDCSSTFEYSAQSLSQGILGGKISEVALLAFIDALYPDTYGENIPAQNGEPIYTGNDEFMAQVETAFNNASVWDLDGGAALSVGFVFQSSGAQVIVP